MPTTGGGANTSASELSRRERVPPRPLPRSSVAGPRTMHPGNAKEQLPDRGFIENDVASFQHRGSAQRLIHRYESMKVFRPVSATRSMLPPSRFYKQSSDFFVHTKEKTAPLRQSFRNLLAVFKKGRPEDILGSASTSKGSSTGLVRSSETATPPRQVFMPVPSSSSSHYTGHLLYLSQSVSSSVSTAKPLPVWIACTATVKNDHILLTWRTAHGNPLTHTIPLASFADVRSLAPDEIDPGEEALLPSKSRSEEPWIFEIVFVGRAGERFAVVSVQDRAGWINAIWDEVLGIQDRKRHGAIATVDPIHKLPSGPPVTGFISATLSANPMLPDASTKSSEKFERDLPPPPRNVSPPTPRPRGISLTDPPPIHTTSPCSLTPPASTPSKSTSIANLKQVSIVKNRLAQLERSNSTSAGASPLSSPSKSRPPMSRSMTSAETAVTLSTSLQRRPSVRSTLSIGESIINSYAEARSPRYLSTRLGSEALTSTYCSSNRSEKVMSPISEYSEKEDDDTQSAPSINVSTLKALPGIPPPSCAEDESSAALDRFSKGLQQLVDRTEGSEDDTKDIYRKLQVIHDEVQQRAVTSDDTRETPKILRIVEEMNDQMAYHFPTILKHLDDAARSSYRDPDPPGDARSPTSIQLSGVHERMDSMLQILSRKPADNGQASSDRISSELTQILALMKTHRSQQAVQTQQQADSVRYLNELNTWLEAFGKNGTSQIQNVADGLERLSQELGSTERGANDSLLVNIQQLVQHLASRTESLSQLENTMNKLVTHMKAQSVDGGSTRESLARLLQGQRHDQENMLRDLANELTNEIRGERLRFVDSMREATKINIDGQVNELRRELTQEAYHHFHGQRLNDDGQHTSRHYHSDYYSGHGIEQYTRLQAVSAGSMVPGEQFVYPASGPKPASPGRQRPTRYHR